MGKKRAVNVEVKLKDVGGNPNRLIKRFIKKVSRMSNIPPKEIIGKSRKMEIAQARQVSMFLSREILGKSLSGIGMYFGGRDHTTVLHACKKINELRSFNLDIEEDYRKLLRVLTI